jgi:hypothetical protein
MCSPPIGPTQALSNLVERYGCVAGYPDGTFKGKQALSRFEAAALLNACLDRVTEVTDELRRLQKEFAKELAVLKGRVDGLEAKVGRLEATQFSTTTKLQGDTYWTLGGVGFRWRDDATTAGWFWPQRHHQKQQHRWWHHLRLRPAPEPEHQLHRQGSALYPPACR